MLRPQSLLLIALGALLACVAYFALAGDASDAGDTRAGAGARGARSDTGVVLALGSLNPEGTTADVAKRSSELTGASRDSELERARSVGHCPREYRPGQVLGKERCTPESPRCSEHLSHPRRPDDDDSGPL